MPTGRKSPAKSTAAKRARASPTPVKPKKRPNTLLGVNKHLLAPTSTQLVTARPDQASNPQRSTSHATQNTATGAVEGRQEPSQQPTSHTTDRSTQIAAEEVAEIQQEPPLPPPRHHNTTTMANAPFNFEELARALMTVRPALPTFSGLDHECPDKYLQKCTAYITATHLPESQQVSTLQEGLQGEAKKWWQNYQVMELDFASYQQLIKSRWSAANGKAGLLAKLYGERQGAKEPVAVFLQQKYLLFARLRPDETEADKVEAMIGLLRPGLRRMVKTYNVRNYATLFSTAIDVERDEEDERATTTRSTEKTLPRCWHCSGRHFNKDCPEQKKKPENWRKAEDDAGPSASQN
ncbi:hypothetical protein TKK_0014850 [Trichogramma kaykai]|uniref:Retrotransposon gag domain-containing protein n=1 Tax=Trichogramma kaykai TaxID=54128 RepID=A0ABD2WBT2_9HYME